MILGTLGFAASWRRRGVAWPRVEVAAINLFCGAIIGPLALSHLVAVIGRALGGKGSGPGGT
ncbi:MAG: hypothetical protein HY654_12695, partial [Acidobacteria bacterium]|nr:hypothetical protein [Acidobacteriota bacterium]